MDYSKIKKDFPIFSVANTPGDSVSSIYLDNAATTHKPKAVIDSIVNFYTLYNSNVHRGLYDSGEFATTLYEAARDKVAKFINAKHSAEVIFTSGTTESINFVAQAWAINNLKQGDEILLTTAEHHANLIPWQRVAAKTGAVLKFIPISPKTFKVENPEIYVTSKTKFVAVTHNSNVLGDIWNSVPGQFENLIVAAKKNGARVLVDAAQSVAHQKIDVISMGIDFMAFSGHKMFAPTGIGVLYIKSELHDQVEPYRVGGGMVHSVSFDSATWTKAPHKFEAGTPSIASAIGLGEAVDYITQKIDFNELQRHEFKLYSKLVNALRQINGIKLLCDFDGIDRLSDHAHLICFVVSGVHSHDIAGALGGNGISLRAGHHCAQPLITSLGFESLVRVSFAVYNTEKDVDLFIEELKKVLKFFGVN